MASDAASNTWVQGSVWFTADARWRLVCVGLAAGCLLLYLGGSGGYDLLTDDEIRYAEAGRRMLQTGNLVIPEFNGYPRYQKPMLFYWLEALSFLLFGVSAWAARLPAALAGTGVVLLTACLGKALWGQRAGLIAGVVLATSVEMFLLSRMVMTDVVLLLFTQGALACFCLLQLSGASGHEGADARRRARLAFLMHACLAMGVLTKGPVAIVLWAVIIGPWLALRGELGRALRDLQPFRGLALILLVAGPWYLLAHFWSEGEFTRQFFLEENLGRFTSVVNLHCQPAIFFLLLLVPMTFPWTGILPQALLAVRKLRLRRAPFEQAAAWFFLWQGLVVLILFSFSQTRVWTYTLPVFPALALLTSRWLATQPAAGRSLRVPLRLMFSASLVLALALQLMPLHWVPAEARSTELIGALRLWVWLLAMLSAAFTLLESRASLHVTLVGLSAGVGLWYAAGCQLVLPVFDRLWKQPVRELAEMVRAHPRCEVVTYNAHELGLNFHAQVRHVPHIRTRYRWELERVLGGSQRVFVLVSPEGLADLAGMPFHVLGGAHRLVYGSNYPASGE